MKTKSIITLATYTILLLTGCTKSDQITEGKQVISLQAGLKGILKSVIDNDSEFTAAVAGWESILPTDYATAKAWMVTTEITAAESSVSVILDPQPYYSQNNAVKTYIKAWHPEGILNDDGTVNFSSVSDGSTDVLLAGEVVGSAHDTGLKSLMFKHMLSQLRFEVVCDNTFIKTTTIKAITIKDAKLPMGLDLKTDAVMYGSTTELPVPKIDETIISTTAQVVGQPVMLKPYTANTFRIDVETSAAIYRDVIVTIDNDIDFQAGKAYTITISFTRENTDINASAIVASWVEGTGSGSITTN